MNKAIFIILIAILATTSSTVLQLSMRGREVSPALRRSLWGIFIAGVAALIITLILVGTR